MRVTPPVARSLSTFCLVLGVAASAWGIWSLPLAIAAVLVVGVLLVFIASGRSIPRVAPWIGGALMVALALRPTALAPLIVSLLVIALAIEWAADVGAELEFASLRRPMILAVAAGLLAALLTGLTIGPLESPSAGSAQAPARPASDGGSGSWLSDPIARLFGSTWSSLAEFFTSNPGPGSTPAAAEPPRSDINWMRVVLFVLAVAALVALVWWLLRRRSGEEVVEDGADWAVRSLDRTGERVARPRRASEDPATYGASIGGDVDQEGAHGRLRAAGAMVSERLYRPAGDADGDDRRLRSTLAELADLPSAPTPPRRSRV